MPTMEAVLIGVGVVILVLIIVRATRRKRAAVDNTAVMRDLRERALTGGADEVGIAPEPGKPWAVMMETGYPGAVVSLVAFADGSTSLYFSSGGGVLGGGEHASVNEASRAFVAKAADDVQHVESTSDHPLPPEGMTRFYFRIDDGLRTAEAPENELGEGRHPLSALFHAGQEVLTQLRLISGG